MAAASTALQPLLTTPVPTRHTKRPVVLPPRACRECATAACAVSRCVAPPPRLWQRSPAAPLAALRDGPGEHGTPGDEEGEGVDDRATAGEAPSSLSTPTTTTTTFASTNPMLPSDGDSPALAAALAALRFYKAAISPLLPTSCRFLPTCSEYSASAYRKFGIVKGTVLTAWRLLRCQPWGGRGFDPPVWPPPGLRGTGGGDGV